MVTLCWAAKGGSGTTVVAAAIALTSARHALLVDLDGELPAMLGVPEPDRPGVVDWLASDAPPEHLHDLAIHVDVHVTLLPCSQFVGRGTRAGGATGSPIRPFDDQRWRTLASWLKDQSGRNDVVIDAGTCDPHPAIVEVADRALLVTRPCYLSLRRTVQSSTMPTGIIVVAEPGRALTSGDIERAVGAPVVATVSLDPAIARAVDAGLLATSLPRVIGRELRRVAA